MDRSKLYRRFRTLLIANRGEIACRVIRSARAMPENIANRVAKP